MATFERCVDIASYPTARSLNSAQANILIDDGLNALVSDFGMAFYEKGTGDVYHWENINPAWLAPELISARYWRLGDTLPWFRLTSAYPRWSRQVGCFFRVKRGPIVLWLGYSMLPSCSPLTYVWSISSRSGLLSADVAHVAQHGLEARLRCINP